MSERLHDDHEIELAQNTLEAMATRLLYELPAEPFEMPVASAAYIQPWVATGSSSIETLAYLTPKLLYIHPDMLDAALLRVAGYPEGFIEGIYDHLSISEVDKNIATCFGSPVEQPTPARRKPLAADLAQVSFSDLLTSGTRLQPGESIASTRSDSLGDWREEALCAQTDPEVFFPDKGGSTAAAKSVCRSCEVREECLDFALNAGERFGIWGGLSERERRKLRKKNPAEDVEVWEAARTPAERLARLIEIVDQGANTPSNELLNDLLEDGELRDKFIQGVMRYWSRWDKELQRQASKAKRLKRQRVIDYFSFAAGARSMGKRMVEALDQMEDCFRSRGEDTLFNTILDDIEYAHNSGLGVACHVEPIPEWMRDLEEDPEG